MTDFGRILILGRDGQLGIALRQVFGNHPGTEAYGRDIIDLANEESIRKIVRQTRPKIILNAAAYTAVDRAESEPELAMAINGVAPRILAEEASKLDALLVHYSTDYVFDGSKPEPWVETDMPAPLNVYGHTKLAGERSIMEYGDKYLIFRTSWVFSSHGKNFMLTILRLAQERDTLNVVNDQHGAPTSAEELAKATRIAIEKLDSGALGATKNWADLYHMTCSGSTTWCNFAQSILEEAKNNLNGRTPRVVGISSEDYPTPARRPRNSVLNNQKLQATFGIRLPFWKDALQAMGKSL